jgi:hypothetical protein
MKSLPKHKPANRKDRVFADRLKKALKQPGVKEAMEVYGNWRRKDESARPYRQAMAGRKIVYLSNTSNPKDQRNK